MRKGRFQNKKLYHPDLILFIYGYIYCYLSELNFLTEQFNLPFS